MKNLLIKYSYVVLFITISFVNFSCKEEQDSEVVVKHTEEEKQQIIEEALGNAYKHDLYSQEFQEELDVGLAKDPTLAYLWQQKAMPLYKQGKYEVGKPFLDKAVQYNRDRYLDYRAFMECIFAKNYREAITEFKKCVAEYGNSYVMDQTYNCYIGISHLMLNEFETAEAIFEEDIETITKQQDADWIHPLELFYYGLSCFEQKKYEKAVSIFNSALDKYPTFSDVQYYKAIALARLNKLEEARIVMKSASKNAKLGNTINEDNAIYERYPYQVRLNTYKMYESN